jgi:hypothetical protein
MTDRLEALERLARLKASGILTLTEFEVEKSRILGESVVEPQRPDQAGDLPGHGSQAATWRTFLLRPWLLVGGALALVTGALLAYVVVGDVRSATRAQRAERSVVPKAPAAAGGGAALGSLLGFRDASTCTPGQGLEDLIGAMISARNASNPAADASIRVAGLEEPVVPTISSPAGAEGATIIQIPMQGTWQGLHVTRFHTATWGADDMTSLQIQFNDPVDETRSVLRQIGFPLGRAGELQKAGPALVGVEAVPGGSALTCARGPKSVADGREDTTAD